MSTLIIDIKYAIRQTLKAPSFTLVTVLTLALGIGVNAAVFGVLYRVVLKPLPFPESERLVQLKVRALDTGQGAVHLTAREFESLSTGGEGFERVAGFAGEIRNLSGIDVPVRAFGERVSQGFLETFGTQPCIGRGFSKEDYSVGQQPVVLISHRLWCEQFEARPDIVGQDILLDGIGAVVCGVMPKDFQYPYRHTTHWRPLVLTDEERQDTTYRFISVVGRTAPGVTSEQLNAQLQRFAFGYQERHAIAQEDCVTFSGVRLVKERIGSAGRVLWILFGAVSCVTLIGFANLVNVFISRLITRRKELIVRMALGAGPWRIGRQWLTESCLISLLAGAVGMTLTCCCIRPLRSSAPYGLPRAEEIAVDATIVGYGFLLSLVMGVGVSLIPLVRFLHTMQYHQNVLKSYDRDDRFTGRRSRFWLVGSQFTVATVLLIGAGLFWNSFRNVIRIDPGFSPDHLLSARIVLAENTFTQGDECQGFYGQLMDRVAALPDIPEAGLVNALPLSDILFKRPFLIKELDGDQPSTAQGLIRGNYTSVSLNYFKLMGIPLLAGRAFRPTDENGAPVVIVSESLAQRYFGDREVLGRQIKIGLGKWRPWMTIVGVVDDVKSSGRDVSNEPTFYVPFNQKHLPTYTMRGMFIVAKTREAPEVTVKRVRAALCALNPDLALANIETMRDRLHESASNRRYHTSLMAVFAFLALVLVEIGIFGMLSRWVVDRQREMGIRMALGSDRSGLFRLILKQGLKPVAIGILTGWGMSLALQGVLSGLLFGVSPNDPKTFLGVGIILFITATLACYIPARRAAKIDPMEALRYE